MDWFFDHPEPLGPVGLMPMGGPDVAADAFGRFGPDQPWLPAEGAGGKLDDLDLFLAEFTDSYNPGDIEVTGERPSEELDFFLNGRNHGTGDGGTSGGATGGTGGGEPPPPPPPPPCGGGAPNGPTPAGVDMDALRAMARTIASDLAGRNDGWEWGALIYTIGGQLFSTQPITQQSSSSIGFTFGAIPDGATIVAWVHTHPDLDGSPDQDGLSSDDNHARSTMVDASNGRFAVDPNLMTYILDNDTGKLLEFDEDDGVGSRGVNVTPCGGL